MALRLEDLAKTIDHTLLAARAQPEDLARLCEEACEHHFASVCILPAHVANVSERLRGCDVKVCAVVGLPLGAADGRSKVRAAELCVAQGADELDFVMNVPAMLAGDVWAVRDELVALTRVVRMKSVNGGRDVVVKVVVEAPRLDDGRKKLACRIVEQAGADFAQTSAGPGLESASAYDVELLRECLSENVGVKAAGGVESAEDVLALVNAGASRIGVHAGVAIMQGFVVGEPV